MSRITPRHKERAQRMADLYRSGKTLQQIGDEYGVTRERVRQLIKFFFGLTRKDSGRAHLSLERDLARARVNIEKRAAKEARRYEKYLGCSPARYKDLTGEKWNWTRFREGNSTVPGNAYYQQKRNAKVRGIEWGMTFPEWWGVWQESGKWRLRGRGKGYCMARQGDSGPYTVGNVYICTVGQNFSDSYLVHPWAERFPNVTRKPFSIYICRPATNRANPFQLHVRGEYVGYFPTREAAEQAAQTKLAA